MEAGAAHDASVVQSALPARVAGFTSEEDMTTDSRLVVTSSQGRKGGFHVSCACYEGFQRVQQLRLDVGLLPFLIDRSVAVRLGQKPKKSMANTT